jgi:hypothetical protein
MAVVQISRVMVRSGEAKDLPDAMAEGELGFALDTGGLFIGHPTFAPIQHRSGNPGIYPYRNIKILTELDVQHTVTGDVYYHGPIQQYTVASTGSVQTLTTLWNVSDRNYAIYDYSLTPVSSLVTKRRMGSLMVMSDGTTAAIQDTGMELNSGNTTAAVFTVSLNVGTGDVSLRITHSSAQTYTLQLNGREWTQPASPEL